MKNAAEIVEKVEARYFEMHYGPEIAALTAMEELVAEADAAVQVARNTLQSEAGLDDKLFNGIMNPIERKVGAPWLKKMGEQVVVIVPGESAKPATPEQLSEGVYYQDFAEY